MSEDEREPVGWIEARGKTVSEATEAALARLGVGSPDEAVVEVLEEAQRRLLGLGGREARVRVRLREDKGEAVLRVIRDILGVLGLGGALATVSRKDDGYVRVNLEGGNLGVLIGRRGETLDALQYLLNLAASRLPGPSERIILDVGGYRERRRVTLERLAERVADTVRRTGREMALEPMTPQERKVIHMFLSREDGVTSESRGEEPFRRVIILPDGTTETGEPEEE